MPRKSTDKSEKAANQSSDRLLQILECIADNRLPIRLQDLAGQLHMSQATVLRYLTTLQNTGYIYQEEDTLRYALTWKVCRLCTNLQSPLSLRSITSPFINQLAGELGLGVCLVIEQNHECLYLDCIDNSDNFNYTLQRIGKAAPMHATGSGKLFLSRYTDSQLDAYIADKGLPRFTDYTLTTREALTDRLVQIRENGYATDDRECEDNLQCVSAPLYDYMGRIAAGLSVFGPAEQLSPTRITEEILPPLMQAAKSISARLGYEGIEK